MRRFAETELVGRKYKRAVTFFVNSQHSRVTMLASCLVVPENRNKGLGWKQTGPDWDFHYLMLDHLSNCNISPGQICPFMLCEFWVGLFYLVPNPKLIFRPILVIVLFKSEPLLTLIWHKAHSDQRPHISQCHWSKSYLHDKDIFI